MIQVTELSPALVGQVVAKLTTEIDLLWDEDCDRTLLDLAIRDRGDYIGIQNKLRDRKPVAALKEWEWLDTAARDYYTDLLR